MGRSFAQPTANAIDLQYNPRQIEFLNLLDAYRGDGKRLQFDHYGLFAGRRGGKTMIGGIAAAKLAMRQKCYGWVCAPTYVDLHDFVEPAVFACLPRQWIANWSSEFRELTLANGSIIAFRSLEDPEKARGPGLDWVWIDEGRKIQERAYQTMRPALTSGGWLKVPGLVILTTSPNGFDWCHKEFWKPAEEGEPGFWACKYKTVDNPTIDKAEIERDRRRMDPLFFQQEYEADFVTFTGAIYGGVLEQQILRTEAEVKVVYPNYLNFEGPPPRGIMGLDPGADHPFAGVLILETPTGIICAGEYEERNRPVKMHVDGLEQVVWQATAGRGMNDLRWSMDKTQRQFFIELSQWGLNATEADNRVVDGIRRVQSWLAARRLWIIEAACPRLVKRLRTYRWAENTRKDGQVLEEKPLKRDDDLCDALRYAVMGFPELPAWERDNVERAPARMVAPAYQWEVDRAAAIAKAERRAGEADPDNPVGDFYERSQGRTYERDDSDEDLEETESYSTIASAFWET